MPVISAKQMRGRRKFSDEQIKWILTENISGVQKAKRLNCSRQAIQNILLGKVYVDVHPEIPRIAAQAVPGASSCHKCAHWVTESAKGAGDGHCGMGFPDPIEEGPGFARDCNTFLPRRKKQSPKTAKGGLQ